MATDRTGDPLIGRRIAAAREARDLTQKELASLLGYSEGWIADIERGRRNISVVEIGRCAVALGASTDQFILGREPESGAQWLRLQPYWDKLSKTDRDFALASFERQMQHLVAAASERPPEAQAR